MITFLAFLEVALCYTIAGAVYHAQIEELTSLKKPHNFAWIDALFLAFAPVSIPSVFIYLMIIFFANKNDFND